MIDGSNMPPTPTAQRWYIPQTSSDEPSIDQIVDLGRRLGVPIEFDRSGWISADIEIRMGFDAIHHAVTPRSARVSRESPVDALAAQGGVTARCLLYNESLRALRLLRTDLDAYLTRAELRADDAMRLQSERDNLAGLDYVVHGRQRERMGSGVVTLRVLDKEIEFLKSWHTYSRRILASVQGTEPEASDAPDDAVGLECIDHEAEG